MPEDLDDDCVVTVIDIMRVAVRWGQAGGPEDVNSDGTVDVGDVQQVAGQWRETCHVLAGTTKYYTLGGRRVAMRKAGTLCWLLTDHPSVEPALSASADASAEALPKGSGQAWIPAWCWWMGVTTSGRSSGTTRFW